MHGFPFHRYMDADFSTLTYILIENFFVSKHFLIKFYCKYILTKSIKPHYLQYQTFIVKRKTGFYINIYIYFTYIQFQIYLHSTGDRRIKY